MKKLSLCFSFLLVFFLSAEAFASCAGTPTACTSRGSSYESCIPLGSPPKPSVVSTSVSETGGCTWTSGSAAGTLDSGACTGGTLAATYCANLLDAQCTTVPGCTTIGTVNNNMLVSTICKGLGIVTGTFGKVVAAFAVISVGIGFFTGKVSWGLMIGVTAGIAAMFGANTIVAAVSGSSVASCS